MGLSIMIAGLVLFLGTHLLTTMRERRAAIVERLGEGPYKGVYSLLSVIGICLIGWGFSRYRAMGWIDIWYPPQGLQYLTIALMFPAIILLVAAYLRGHIYRVVKNPMLVAVKLWAVAHLFDNGDLGSMILFGSFLAWAVVDRISLTHRNDAGAPPIPVGGIGNDLLAIGVGAIAYLAIGFVFHPIVIGVPVFGV
jgi:uncharacterized membrane protein